MEKCRFNKDNSDCDLQLSDEACIGSIFETIQELKECPFGDEDDKTEEKE